MKSRFLAIFGGLVVCLALGCNSSDPTPVANNGSTGQTTVAPENPAPATEPPGSVPPGTPPDNAPRVDPTPPPNPDPNAPPNPNPEPPVPVADPFPRRIDAPEFPADLVWINSAPLQLKDLRGKFVLLDFWTYCCINCMHILPELKKLERAFPNELIVIGVHSAKFTTEKGTKNIEEAVLRYEIEHPVVNDAEHEIWESFGVQSWPSIRLIDPEGQFVAGDSGEFTFEQIEPFFRRAIEYYRQQGKLDETPVRFDLARDRQAATPLRFPGKVLADEASGRLFISDSNHNRIVVTDLDGKFLDAIGSGEEGRADGDFATATFNHPQGVALRGTTLYVADTENHMLRKVDLAKRQVTTSAGNGTQRRKTWPGVESATDADSVPDRFVGKPATTELNSPWDVWLHEKDLYIAMAGPHQIWKMTLDEAEIGPYAGNGREDIVDGRLLPPLPYDLGFSSFAQPSGLSSDGTWLFVADSEGSSIRAVPFDPKKEVRTIVGSAHLPRGRLFAFGDEDGPAETAKLQHALAVVFQAGKLYVADTYNSKIKIVDAETGETKTLAGTGKSGKSDAEGTFAEPAGLSFAKGRLYVADTNNHLIRTVDPATGKVATLQLTGVEPPPAAKPAAKSARKPNFAKATQVAVPEAAVKPADGAATFTVKLAFPDGWKVNAQAPMAYYVAAEGETGPIVRDAIGTFVKLPEPAAMFDVKLPVSGEGADTLKVFVDYYYCQEGSGGLCKTGTVVWTVPVKVSATGGPAVLLEHRVK